MPVQEAFTTFSIVKSCRKLTADVLANMLPVANRVKQRSLASHKPEWEVLLSTYGNDRVIYSAYYSKYFSQDMVIVLKHSENYIEAYAYDSKQGRYHYYHEHFFEKYAQRFSLQHKTPEEVVLHYFKHNPLTVYSRYRKVKKGLQELYAIVNLGVIHGFIDLNYRITHFRTIISNYKLGKKRRKWSYGCRHILQELQKEW